MRVGMNRMCLIFLGLTLAACSSDAGSSDGADTLPKRGEVATDPTIVSATARCAACSGEICSGDVPPNSYVFVRVDSSDPMGVTNLGNCAGMLANNTDQDTYGDGQNSSCRLFFKLPCAVGQNHVVDLTVSNSTGGVTSASVKLTVSE